MEEVSKLQGRLKELKQSKEAALEAKAMLEDELQSMKHKLVILSKIVELYIVYICVSVRLCLHMCVCLCVCLRLHMCV